MSKRSNGEGCLRKRSNGRWELTIMDGYHDNGRRKCKSFYGDTQKEVRDKLNAYRAEKSRGLDMDANYDFSEWADLWYDLHKDNITVTTQENYKYTLKILKGYFSNKKLREIKAIDVELMLRSMAEQGRSISYRSKCRGLLFQILNKAEANDFILKNPVRFADKARYREVINNKDSFTVEEVQILMEKLPDNLIGNSIRLLLGSGMRTQELLALQPEHIEPDGSMIYVRQAVVMQKGTAVIGPTKTVESIRNIPIPDVLRECAVSLRQTGSKYIWESSKKLPGNPCNPSHFRSEYKKALEAIPEVRKLTPHCCRHTYVSQMQAIGVDLGTIGSIVGHTDVKTTKHYLHVQEPVRRSAANQLGDIFVSREDPDKDPENNKCKLIPFKLA